MSSVAAVQHAEKTAVLPLTELVVLIRQDVARAHEAAEAASEPYYIAAGNKLLEAKLRMKHGEFTVWVRKHFKFGIRNAQLYMSVARATLSLEKRNAVSHFEDLSFREAIREHTGNANFGKTATWRADMEDNIQRAKEQAKRLRNERLSRRDERAAEHKLALQLIDIGFKALASKLHPDKGGSKDAMARLNRVRKHLQQHA